MTIHIEHISRPLTSYTTYGNNIAQITFDSPSLFNYINNKITNPTLALSIYVSQDDDLLFLEDDRYEEHYDHCIFLTAYELLASSSNETPQYKAEFYYRTSSKDNIVPLEEIITNLSNQL